MIDSGARISHADLAPNLWTNPGEIPGNNRDDDRNGYVDDIHGIDTIGDTGNPTPPADEDHGTHVAGIIGAAANNGVAGAGVAWRVQMMHLRFLGRGEEGRGLSSDAIECINYAIEHGADVINASYGSDSGSSIVTAAIRRARDADIIFVAAAGNDGEDLDISSAFPANYLIDNIVSVANSTRLGDLSTTSNYGSGIVDLAAPGSNILSLSASGNNATLLASGTSMAAPMVTGAVALLRAQYPADNYRDIINRLLRGTRKVTAFSGQVQTGGQLDVAAALQMSDTRPFNDDFDGRAVLDGEIVRVRNSTWNATPQAGEPAHAGRLSRSIWFTWISPTGGEVQIDSRDSIGDTTLSVYTGVSVNNLSLVAENDNESSGFLTSKVIFEATAGTPYHIALDSSSPGLAVLNLAASAANDQFDSALPLTGDAPLITTTNIEATREPGEPSHGGGALGRSLWYQWTAPTDQKVQVSAYSPQVHPVLAVYTGSSVNSLNLIGQSRLSGPTLGNLNPMVEFEASEEVTYHIALDTTGFERAEITLSLTDASWIFSTDGPMDSEDPDFRRPRITNVPTVGPDGVIYVSSSDSHMYAINPDGSMKWRTQTDGHSDSSSAALGADGTLYFGIFFQPLIYAINSDGSIKWSNTIGESGYVAAPAIAADGTIYFKQTEGILRAISPAGNELWNYPILGGEGSYGGPAVGAGGTIFYPANDGAIHALSPSGELRWRYQPKRVDGSDDSSEIYTSPSIDADGNLYAATLNGTVFSITPSGSVRWIFYTPEPGENVSSSIALGDGKAYFASYGGYLYALDQRNGAQIWRSSIEAQARASSPAIAADGSIIVGSYANKLFHFKPDGELIRRWSAGNWFRSSPTIADGQVYVGNGDGRLYAFDLDGIGPAAPSDTYPWPQYRHGPRNLGRATIETIGQIITPDPTNPGRLANLSVRNRTERGTGVLTAGFVMAGDSTKELVVRGVGPTLANFDVAGSIAATELRVFSAEDTATPLDSNRNWRASIGDGRELGAFLLPDGSNDSVVRRAFGNGGFTTQVLPATSDTDPGVALLEIYDADLDDLGARLINLSARTEIAADSTVTVGFVLVGTTPRTLLIRAVGPGLTDFGVDGALSDPTLLLLRGQVAESGNDDWGGSEEVRSTAEAVGAFPLLNSSADAALVTTLPPGAYTAQVTAPPGQSGVVLVEVYLVAE